MTQAYVGYYYINNLRTRGPNFIHTYFHKTEETQTKLFIEYVDTITLDKKLGNMIYKHKRKSCQKL